VSKLNRGYNGDKSNLRKLFIPFILDKVMIPGLGGIDPRKMQQIMKQMGIKQESVDVVRVIMEKLDGGRIVVEPAHVEKISMNGQESWQITGEAREEAGGSEQEAGIREEDIKLVMEKTGKSGEEAKRSLEEANGDIAEAILNLS